MLQTGQLDLGETCAINKIRSGAVTTEAVEVAWRKTPPVRVCERLLKQQKFVKEKGKNKRCITLLIVVQLDHKSTSHPHTPHPCTHKPTPTSTPTHTHTQLWWDNEKITGTMAWPCNNPQQWIYHIYSFSFCYFFYFLSSISLVQSMFSANSLQFIFLSVGKLDKSVSISGLLCSGGTQCDRYFFGAGGFTNDFAIRFLLYLARDSSYTEVLRAAFSPICFDTSSLQLRSSALFSSFVSLFVFFTANPSLQCTIADLINEWPSASSNVVLHCAHCCVWVVFSL